MDYEAQPYYVLMTELRRRGLMVDGLKVDIIRRLKDHDERKATSGIKSPAAPNAREADILQDTAVKTDIRARRYELLEICKASWTPANPDPKGSSRRAALEDKFSSRVQDANEKEENAINAARITRQKEVEKAKKDLDDKLQKLQVLITSEDAKDGKFKDALDELNRLVQAEGCQPYSHHEFEPGRMQPLAEQSTLNHPERAQSALSPKPSTDPPPSYTARESSISGGAPVRRTPPIGPRRTPANQTSKPQIDRIASSTTISRPAATMPPRTPSVFLERREARTPTNAPLRGSPQRQSINIQSLTDAQTTKRKASPSKSSSPLPKWPRSQGSERGGIDLIRAPSPRQNLVSATLLNPQRPYIHIPANNIEVKDANFEPLIRKLAAKSIKYRSFAADRLGYYIIFAPSAFGESNARDCLKMFEKKLFEGRAINAELFLRGHIESVRC